VRAGEIHALLGENGAGKSTLVKQVYGVLQPDAGSIFWEGREVTIRDPHAARRLGIGMGFQHFSLFEAMTVAENIALGLEERPDRRRLAERIRGVSRDYGLALEPDRTVDDLSVGERQRIEIVRCLLQSPRLLIMDEPTSVLTPQETSRLFDTLRTLADQGCSILYISHKLEEIRTLCERATILRGGRVVASCDPRRESARGLAEAMIGTKLRDVTRPGAGQRAAARPRLQVERLSLAAEEPHGTPLREVSFEAREGEILGIAGVAGNGQGELLAALAGERPADSADSIRIDGRAVGRLSPDRRRRLGLCTLPEERNGEAAVGEMTLWENAILTAYHRRSLVGRGLLRRGAAETFAAQVIERFDVRTAGPGAAAGSLSGGNLQKFVVGREILQRPEVLVIAQPTWGIDAAAAKLIQQALVDLAAQGSAVVVISQDLDELLELSDRLAVMNVGRLSPARPTRDYSQEAIGLLMGGIHGDPAAASPTVA